MKIAGYLLAGFLILGLIGMATKGLLIVILAGLVIGFIRHPQQTLGVIVTFLLFGFIGAYPWPGVLLICALFTFAAVTRSKNE